MRSNTIRLFILIASVLIAIIIAVQLYWLNKTYTFEKTEFNTSVIKSIRGVYEDLPLLYESTERLQALIEKTDANSYLFRVDSIPAKDSLIFYMHSELEGFDIFTDGKLSLYDNKKNKYVYDAYLPSAGSGYANDTASTLPLIQKDYSYAYLHFPHRNKYIIEQMTGWIVSSGLLLLVLLGFAASLYYFFKQKFLVEIQKDFINNVTHEFSTPLSVIELSVDGLEKPTAHTNLEKQQKFINAIRYQSDYLKNHISNLVKTVVADQYQFVLRMKPVIPNELLKKVIAQLEPLLNKKAGIIEWDLEEENSSILADEENLYLSFFNIINNAIKYSLQPKIIISTVKNSYKYIISIKDNGAGMESSEYKKIFKKFYRVQNGNVHNTKGLGLGLYFTKKVIDGHHGKIDVHSLPGIGTEFKIELPLKH
ncbi:MAG: HAMP domain-containing histidine kinase [Bacteroidetes bacterium]|jgi:two-component system phosphate regulon sensor histidine kinase PhoR|nr:MAG: HAMP domain-containing histidine kinase [Bacteroidota bacterium]